MAVDVARNNRGTSIKYLLLGCLHLVVLYYEYMKKKEVIHNDALKQYEKACDNLAHFFAKKYFGRDYDMYWVAENIGDTVFINDYFFDVQDMYTYLKLKATSKQMFGHYDFIIEAYATGTTRLTFHSWKRLSKKK